MIPSISLFMSSSRVTSRSRVEARRTRRSLQAELPMLQGAPRVLRRSPCLTTHDVGNTAGAACGSYWFAERPQDRVWPGKQRSPRDVNMLMATPTRELVVVSHRARALCGRRCVQKGSECRGERLERRALVIECAAPSVRTCSSTSGPSKPKRTTTPVAGEASRMRGSASLPSISGMEISRTNRSGCRVPAMSMASRPSPASRTICITPAVTRCRRVRPGDLWSRQRG
jgi:hypothetical protein